MTTRVKMLLVLYDNLSEHVISVVWHPEWTCHWCCLTHSVNMPLVLYDTLSEHVIGVVW